MNTKPWMRNAAATANRLRLRLTARILPYGGRVTTWERRTEWPLTIAAVVFLGAYAWPILDPGLPDVLATTCATITWVVWALFAADYVARVSLADDRVSWVVRHPLELFVLVLPMFRPLRALRLVTLLRVLNRSAAGNLSGRVAIYVTAGSSLIAFIAALAALEAERDADGALITSFGDAMWWACTTMTTVGYGDTYPVTTTGRFIGVGLMIGGIALLGTVTATFASWLVNAVRDEQEATEDELDDVQAQLRVVREQLDRLLEERR
jgi:voltage-gated potassium channel